MNTQTFLNTLENNGSKDLLFEYANGNRVKANYHITEIKNTTYDTVDCGGNPNYWQETIVQLWENPKEEGKRQFMKSEKALQIFKRVDSIKPLLKDTIIKFEYGNERFHTAHLPVHDIEVTESSLLVKLTSDTTLCKASDTCCAQESKELETTAHCC